MSPTLATLIYAALILGLFWLDRDHGVRTAIAIRNPLVGAFPPWFRSGSEGLRSAQSARVSFALWLPVIWLALAGSRSVSEWLNAAPPGTSAEALLEGDPINRLVYSGLVGMALVVLCFRGTRVVRFLRANAVVVVFLLYCALSLMWAEHPNVGFKRWVKAIGDFVMVLIVVTERDPSVAIRRFLTRTGFLLIPLSVLMIKYFPHIARYYDRWDWSTYYSGVTTNKNSLGVICLLFGLASAAQLLAAISGRNQTGRVRRLIAHGAILAMAVWLFKFANSMTSLVCFFLGLAVLVVVEIRPLVRIPLLVPALVAVLIAFPSAVLFIGIETVLAMIGRDPTLTDRTEIWGLLLTLTTNVWVGAGFENFWLGSRLNEIWTQYSWGPTQAHNGYLEIFLNLGWVGIALVVIMLLRGYRTVMTGLYRYPSTGNLMLAYFVVGIVYNFTEAALFRITAPAWIVFLLAITRIPAIHNVQAQRSVRARPTGRMPSRRGAYGAAQEPAVAISRDA